MEAPTMAGYGSATDLAPVDSYKPLLGAAWPELARRYLQEHAALSIGEDAVDAALRLKVAKILHYDTYITKCTLSFAPISNTLTSQHYQIRSIVGLGRVKSPCLA